MERSLVEQVEPHVASLSGRCQVNERTPSTFQTLLDIGDSQLGADHGINKIHHHDETTRNEELC